METKLIFAKIPAIMSDMDAVGKTKTNSGQGYKFRGIDDIYNALHIHLAKHKVFAITEVISKEIKQVSSNNKTSIHTLMDVKVTFYAEDGSNVSCMVVGEAMDFGDKSANKAMSMAFKYAMMQTFCIPTEEKLDTESENHDINQAAAKQTAPVPAKNTVAKTPPAQTPAQNNQVKPAPAITPAEAINNFENEKPADPLATTKQKAEILLLLNHESVSEEQKKIMVANINKLTVDRANKALENLRKSVAEYDNAKEVAV